MESSTQALQSETTRFESNDNLPVLWNRTRAIDRPVRSLLPAPVAAASGFVAGVATLFLAHRLRQTYRRRTPPGLRRRNRALKIASSRSFLVDVHLIER
jgi:hypothetical protein